VTCPQGGKPRWQNWEKRKEIELRQLRSRKKTKKEKGEKSGDQRLGGGLEPQKKK